MKFAVQLCARDGLGSLPGTHATVILGPDDSPENWPVRMIEADDAAHARDICRGNGWPIYKLWRVVEDVTYSSSESAATLPG